MSVPPIRYRRHLDNALAFPLWPRGITVVPLTEHDAPAVHALLASAYLTGFGEVPPYPEWWSRLNGDAEFDPALCLVARADYGSVAGYCQCWTSSFIKDIAVTPAWRRRGLARALLLETFALMVEAGHPHIDLKVHADNRTAAGLYESVGMVAVHQ